MGFNTYILSVSFSFTRVHLTALFPVPHSQPLLLGCHTATDESWEWMRPSYTCTSAVHKNNCWEDQNMLLYSVICILELGSNFNWYERWPPFCLPSINHPQDTATFQSKLGGSCVCGAESRKTFIMVGKTNWSRLWMSLIPTWRPGRNNVQQECHPVDCMEEQQWHTRLPCIHLLVLIAHLGKTPFTYWTPICSCGRKYPWQLPAPCQRLGVAWFSLAHTT